MEAILRSHIEEALRILGIESAPFSIEHPTDTAHGDYATNVAMVVEGNPRAIAETLVEQLEAALPDNVKRIEIAGPGFINFYLHREFYAAHVKEALSEAHWGATGAWKGKTVIVEYTDPNPFKELHIGHLVPNALGESLARLFMMSGADTKRVTFQGDVGMHVAKAMYGLLKLDIEPDAVTPKVLGTAYAHGATAFEESDDVKKEIKKLNTHIYLRDDERINTMYDIGKRESLTYFERAYKILGSEFDHNFFESVTGPVGLALVRAHMGDIFEESDGAVIFKGEKYGLHTRVFVNKEGLPTYEAKDMGLIKCKADWQPFDLALTVTGTEQTEYFKVTTKASELIQPDLAGKVELVPNGMLRLSDRKMSSRTGDVIPVLSFIDEVAQEALDRMKDREIQDKDAVAEMVAVAAIKYTILKIGTGKNIVFDMKKSISFEGDSGPYLQYTYARIMSLLHKAESAGIAPSTESAPEEPYAVEKHIYQFPEVVRHATAERAPHHLVTYLTELTGAFNTFYGAEKIVDATDPYAPYKLSVAKAVAVTLKNGLWGLGINVPEEM